MLTLQSLLLSVATVPQQRPRQWGRTKIPLRNRERRKLVSQTLLFHLVISWRIPKMWIEDT
jgi:hypothetical protein